MEYRTTSHAGIHRVETREVGAVARLGQLAHRIERHRPEVGDPGARARNDTEAAKREVPLAAGDQGVTREVERLPVVAVGGVECIRRGTNERVTDRDGTAPR